MLTQDPNLRQIIHGTSPADSARVAGVDTGDFGLGSPLPLEKVSSYGRQILEVFLHCLSIPLTLPQAVCFLRVKGIPCVHLHLGNIFVDEGTGGCLDVLTVCLNIFSIRNNSFVGL